MPKIVTHRFGLAEMQDAYEVYQDAVGSGALKVALFGDEAPLPAEG